MGTVVESAAAARVPRRRLATLRGKRSPPVHQRYSRYVTAADPQPTPQEKLQCTAAVQRILYPYIALLPTDRDADAHLGS